MSLARRHRERMNAAVASKQAAAPGGMRTGAPASEYELLRARLGVDLRRLKEIQSVERKIELKRELLPEYASWVKGVLDADAGGTDDIIAQVAVWLFDICEFHDALELARYMLRHKLDLPERFKRTLGTFVVEETAEAAARARGQAQDFPVGILLEVEELCAGEDMPDEVRAKLAKEIGFRIVHDAEAIDPDADGPAGKRRAGTARALEYLRRAYGLSHTVGVKKDIDRLERELRKLDTAAAAAGLTE